MNIEEVINKSLFFLSAGFSKPADCKMSSEMLDYLKKDIQNDSEESIFDNIEKETLNFLLSCLSYHREWRSIQSGGRFKFYPNIEELILLIRRIRDRENYLPYPVTGNWADKLVQLETDFNSRSIEKGIEINNLFLSIESKIKNELLKKWLNFDVNKLSYIDPLKDFFQKYPNKYFCLDICSINYDLVIESYFRETGVWLGFSNGQWVGLESEPDLNIENRRINLYKLHGSLNWIKDTAGDIFEKEKWKRQTKDDEREQDIEHDPFIIFGQGIKSFSVEPFFCLIYHFRRLLEQKNYFFVIGYSFFDPYINNLLISATLGTNKKIIIINPEFGPKEICKNPTTNEFGECQLLEYKQKLAEYIKEIQKNSFYSELPEFNVSYVKPDSLIYIPWKTEEFIKKYFSNGGGLLIKGIEKFEHERKKIEKPFE